MRKYMQVLGATVGALAFGCSSTSGDVLEPIDGGADGSVDATTDTSTADTSTDASEASDAPVDAQSCAPDASFDSDPANCGSCGHDCQHGACIGGACQPVLVGSCFQPWGVAVDDTRVYWTCGSDSDGEVRSTRKDGSDLIIHAAHLQHPTSVAVDATTLMFIENYAGKIWMADKLGGAPSIFYDAHTPGGPFTLTFDATSVYWIDVYGSASVFSAPRAGIPDGGAPVPLATGQPYLFAITEDATNVYFTVQGTWVFGPPDAGSDAGNDTSAVMQAPKDHSSPAVALARGVALPKFIAADPNAVYWANADDDTVMRSDHGATTPVVIARVKQPWGVALDGDYVYVTAVATDQGDGSLVRVRKDGTGSPLVVATGLSFPIQPVVDATAIYWTNHAGNSVMKVAK
jgi:hypothetical protein